MRQETKIIATAFAKGKAAKQARTTTDGTSVYLHGNKIVWRAPNGDIWISMCGWPGVTTRERINGMLQTVGLRVSVFQRDHVQYLHLPNGAEIEIDGSDKLNVSEILRHELAKTAMKWAGK